MKRAAIAMSRRWDEHTRARGSFDRVDVQGQTVAVAGWIIHPDEPIDSVALFIEGDLVGQAPVARRDDVGQVFQQIPHAARSGFAFSSQLDPADLPFLDVAVVGASETGKQYVLQRYYPLGSDERTPLPPSILRKRVSGTDIPEIFTNSGADNALQFISFLRKYLTLEPNPRVLDWGCGVGRMDRYIMQFAPDLCLTGCDIDAEAIAWCNTNLQDRAFHVTDPFPPLPFPDASFDAVIGYSVMTHLTWPLQQRWLAEVRRVLKPGGIFITTLHGLFSVNFAQDMAAAVEKAGILDETLDPALDGVAPEGYYRATYQSPDFTRRHWSAFLDVVDYVEGGISALHDIVSMRRS